jgi:hypothetical protein
VILARWFLMIPPKDIFAQIYINTYINKANVIFQFGMFKRTTHKVHMNNAPSKIFKNILVWFWNKKTKKQTNVATHKDLWKYDLILTIQKSLTIKWSKFSKKKFLIWVYHFIIHHILCSYNNFGLWINFIFSNFLCSNQITSPYFSTSKVHYL